MRERIYYYPEVKGWYAFTGFLLIFTSIGFIFSDNKWILFFPSFILGIILILSFKAIVIDYVNKRLETYTDLFFYKNKQYIDLKGYEVVSIIFEKEASRGGIYNSRRSSTTGTSPSVISFEMYMYGLTKSKTFLCEFGSHAEARKLADKMAKHLGFKIEDTIIEGIHLYKKNPWKRRR